MVESSSFVPPKLSVQPDVRVLGARENNLQDVDLTVPRDATVVFTGVSGSGKSSLAFGTLYAESQRRYLESVAPYARRLIDQAAGVRCDRFQIASLRLGVQRPERQRGLSRAGHTGEDDRCIARHREVDILQIVFAGAENANVRLHGELRRHERRGFNHGRMLATHGTVGRSASGGEGSAVSLVDI